MSPNGDHSDVAGGIGAASEDSLMIGQFETLFEIAAGNATVKELRVAVTGLLARNDKHVRLAGHCQVEAGKAIRNGRILTISYQATRIIRCEPALQNGSVE